MRFIALIEVTAAELNGDPPVVGREISHRGIPYRILQVRRPHVRRRSQWMRNQMDTQHEGFRLLVEALANPAEA
jgi:hypothetical protein